MFTAGTTGGHSCPGVGGTTLLSGEPKQQFGPRDACRLSRRPAPIKQAPTTAMQTNDNVIRDHTSTLIPNPSLRARMTIAAPIVITMFSRV